MDKYPVNSALLKRCYRKPGIYLFQNTLNGRAYVGQAIDLKKRLYSHFHNVEVHDNPLYRAVKKYTWDVFEYSILEVVEIEDKILLKKDLDRLEIKYISEYDSYNNGYNQTLGGDGGILGYKMTPEQIQKIKDNHVEPHAVSCVIYNMETKEFLEFRSMLDAAKYIGCNQSQISRRVNGPVVIPYKGYIIKKSKDDVLEALESESYRGRRNNSGGGSSLILSKQEFINLLESVKPLNKKELPLLGMCEKTFYNYLKRYDIESPLETVKRVDHYEVLDLYTNTVHTFDGAESLGRFLNVDKDYARQIGRRAGVYKDRYKITIFK